MVKWSTFITVCVALWVGLSPHPALAQTFDLESSRLPVSQIDSAWRFHLGDDPAWSQPTLDDSAWPVLKPTKSWTAQGVPLSEPFVWFRFRLRAPANTASMVLELPTIHKSYQLFADGKLIAQVGALPPGPAHNVIAAPRVFTIPIGSGSSPKIRHPGSAHLAGPIPRRQPQQSGQRQRLHRRIRRGAPALRRLAGHGPPL